MRAVTVETERAGGLRAIAINRPEARNTRDLAAIRALCG
jgi:enoyl-CoA hydratase/carnithine racemase